MEEPRLYKTAAEIIAISFSALNIAIRLTVQKILLFFKLD